MTQEPLLDDVCEKLSPLLQHTAAHALQHGPSYTKHEVLPTMTGCAPGMGADLLSRMTAPDAVVRRRGSWKSVPYRGHSWWESVFLWQGRALGSIIWPWAVVLAVTAAWSVPVLLLNKLSAFGTGALGALSTAHTAVRESPPGPQVCRHVG